MAIGKSLICANDLTQKKKESLLRIFCKEGLSVIE